MKREKILLRLSLTEFSGVLLIIGKGADVDKSLHNNTKLFVKENVILVLVIIQSVSWYISFSSFVVDEK